MIWRQDGDPPWTWYGAARLRRKWTDDDRYMPSPRDIWEVTAHETADMVVSILAGCAFTEGLGHYRSKWQKPVAEPRTPIKVMSDDERAALARADAIMRDRKTLIRLIARADEKIAHYTLTAHFSDWKARRSHLKAWTSKRRDYGQRLWKLNNQPGAQR